jgi:hypothetical protein
MTRRQREQIPKITMAIAELKSKWNCLKSVKKITLERFKRKVQWTGVNYPVVRDLPDTFIMPGRLHLEHYHTVSCNLSPVLIAVHARTRV